MSDDIEVFFKAFSLKEFFNKSHIEKFGLKPIELAKTKWFKNKMEQILQVN